MWDGQTDRGERIQNYISQNAKPFIHGTQLC